MSVEQYKAHQGAGGHYSVVLGVVFVPKLAVSYGVSGASL
jgi:Leu/Phe-tRNA-protein transferase